METDLFDYLFEGAKSTKHSRIEDYITALIGFMWELDKEFKKEFFKIIITKLSKKIKIDNFELFTQITVMKPKIKSFFKYDIVIENSKTNLKIIIENKIDTKNNQMKKYIRYRDKNENFFLLIPMNYPESSLEDIPKDIIIYWEDLLLSLKNNLNQNNIKTFSPIIQLRKSFFNYLQNYAGIYYEKEKSFDLEFEKFIKKYIKTKSIRKFFIRDASLYPFGFHKHIPQFGLQISDFFNEEIEIFIEDNLTKKSEDKEEYYQEINVLNHIKFKENINYYINDNTGEGYFYLFFELPKTNEIKSIKGKLNNFQSIMNDFIKKYCKNDKDLIKSLLKESEKFFNLLNESIIISKGFGNFCKNIIKFYCQLKSKEILK